MWDTQQQVQSATMADSMHLRVLPQVAPGMAFKMKIARIQILPAGFNLVSYNALCSGTLVR